MTLVSDTEGRDQWVPDCTRARLQQQLGPPVVGLRVRGEKTEAPVLHQLSPLVRSSDKHIQYGDEVVKMLDENFDGRKNNTGWDKTWQCAMLFYPLVEETV